MLRTSNIEQKFLQPFVRCLDDVAWARRLAFLRGYGIFKKEALKALAERGETGPIFLFTDDSDIRKFIEEKVQWGWKYEMMNSVFVVTKDGDLMTTRWHQETTGWTVHPALLCKDDFSDSPESNDATTFAVVLQNLARGWYMAAIPPLRETEEVC